MSVECLLCAPFLQYAENIHGSGSCFIGPSRVRVEIQFNLGAQPAEILPDLSGLLVSPLRFQSRTPCPAPRHLVLGSVHLAQW